MQKKQDEITELLLVHAVMGATIYRLKGAKSRGHLSEVAHEAEKMSLSGGCVRIEGASPKKQNFLIPWANVKAARLG